MGLYAGPAHATAPRQRRHNAHRPAAHRHHVPAGSQRQHWNTTAYHGEWRPCATTLGAQLLDIYHIWCELAEGVRDVEFAAACHTFCESLQASGALAGFRVTRRKLGLGPAELMEWHVMLEFTSLTQLDLAFNSAASRAAPLESFHHAVNSKVKSVRFALYRDFPDAQRVHGQERF